jgi:1,4-dihydroxy-2-naphthoyl-CoA hydrolase
MTHVTEFSDAMPLVAKLGIEIEHAAPQRVCGRLAWAADLCTTGGIMHGGALMALADTVGGICAYLNLPDGAHTATISSSTNMMRSIRDGHVTAECQPVHVGRSMIVVHSDLRDKGGQLTARVTQTQAVLGPQ